MRTRHSIECWTWRPRDCVLPLHVPAPKSLPGGFWQPVTGGVGPGESALQAIAREVREETGRQLPAESFTLAADQQTWKLVRPVIAG
jgi:dihydroneopterin triphosphate diphosphatase